MKLSAKIPQSIRNGAPEFVKNLLGSYLRPTPVPHTIPLSLSLFLSLIISLFPSLSHFPEFILSSSRPLSLSLLLTSLPFSLLIQSRFPCDSLQQSRRWQIPLLPIRLSIPLPPLLLPYYTPFSSPQLLSLELRQPISVVFFEGNGREDGGMCVWRE